MQKLEKNITNLFSDRGKQWLKSLPEIIDALSENWQLTNIQPVDNMTWNYVAKATCAIHGTVVLKVSCDEKLIHDEVKALEHFLGHGMVKLIEHDAKYHATLLHQAIPGRSLRSIYPDKVEQTINNYAIIVKQLVSVTQQNHSNFKHISDWLKALECADKTKLPKGLLEQTIDLKNKLLESSGREFVLHGDLHQDNILSDGDDWIAIDPKGVVGMMEFEVACFDFIRNKEIENGKNIPKLFESRSALIASKLSLDHQKLKDWVFVRLILGACWMIADNGKANMFLNQAKRIFPDMAR